MNQNDSIQQAHRLAMTYLDHAFHARRIGKEKVALDLFRQACQWEAEAADMLLTVNDEPTRSVLYRSAATLALDCLDYQGAKHLAMQGLSGNPPTAIASELREVYDLAVKRLAAKEER